MLVLRQAGQGGFQLAIVITFHLFLGLRSEQVRLFISVGCVGADEMTLLLWRLLL